MKSPATRGGRGLRRAIRALAGAGTCSPIAGIWLSRPSADFCRAIAAAELAARTINNIVQANSAVDDTARAAADLPVHKQTRTAVGEIQTAPMLQRVDSEHLIHRLWFVDSATPASKAKPAGAASCEIRQQIVAAEAAAPTDPDSMPFLAIDTKTPYRADLDPNDVRKTAYYAMRWVNTRGNPRPWSEITIYQII